MSSFASARAELLANHAMPIGELRSALVSLTDQWIQELSKQADVDSVGGAVIAVGGYGRKELAPGSDLDIMLVIAPNANKDAVNRVAEALWYPIWDSGIRLDHSVRTIAQVREMAAQDIKVVLGLLDARTVYGNDNLRQEFSRVVLDDWRALGAKRLMELNVNVRERFDRFGELAYLLEPDLKESFGGLRDISVLQGIAASGVTEVDLARLANPHEFLSDVRFALHQITGRNSDRLLLEVQGAVAQRLNFAHEDDLLRAVCSAGRTMSYISDLTWHRIKRFAAQAPRRKWNRTVLSARTPELLPIAEGVVVLDGEAVLTPDANPASDPVLILRAAAAAAQHGVRLSPQSVEQLARTSAPLPNPWPRAAREALVSLLGAGRLAIPVWEALDQQDVFTRLIPLWEKVRSAPHHNPVHTFTVDRHLVETAINASTMTRRVARPDLLLVGALFHDIGKGYEGDHSIVGAELVKDIAPQLGFDADEVDILSRMTLYHLLLPEMATRRDPDDPSTISHVASIVQNHEMLELLHSLSESDARATGPSVSSEWRMALISDLVRRVHAVLSGDPVPAPPELSAEQKVLANGTGVQVIVDQASTLPMVTVAMPDQVGLLSVIAGVLAIHRLNVRTATTQTIDNRAVSVWGVTSQFGELPSASQLEQDIVKALNGELDIATRLDRRYREMTRGKLKTPEPQVNVIEDASSRATVIELRAHDMPGLLHLVSSAISSTGVDILGARVATLGSEIVDAFYVVDSAGRHLNSEQAELVKRAMLTSLS